VATIYLRKVVFTNEAGQPEVGVCMTQGKVLDWIKVLRKDDTHIMLQSQDYAIYQEDYHHTYRAL
jgi:hypothetical protein